MNILLDVYKTDVQIILRQELVCSEKMQVDNVLKFLQKIQMDDSFYKKRAPPLPHMGII